MSEWRVEPQMSLQSLAGAGAGGAGAGAGAFQPACAVTNGDAHDASRALARSKSAEPVMIGASYGEDGVEAGSSVDRADAGNVTAGSGPASLGLGRALGLFGKGRTLDVATAVDDKPVHVDHNIFIGSLRAAFNHEALRKAGVTHILNLSNVEDTYPGHFAYMSIHMRDCESQDLFNVFEASATFIHSGCRGGSKVLVHCNAGRSRSPAIIMAYLIVALEYTFDNALKAVVAVRPNHCVNPGFIAQLRALSIAKGNVQGARELVELDDGEWKLQVDGGDSVASTLPRLRDKHLYRRVETS